MVDPRRPTLAAAIVVAAVGAAACAADRSSDPPAPPTLSGVETFAFAIGEGTTRGNLVRRYAGYDLVVLDGEEAPERKVAGLREAGKVVLAYLSVGTIERWRGWYREARPYRLRAWRDWEGEWFADVSESGYRDLIAERVAPRLLEKGFDGLFLDNTDMIATRPALAPGMQTLVGRLGELVHADGGYLFAQNGDRTVRPMLADLDGWNREDVTSTWDFDRDRYALIGRREHRAALAAVGRISDAGKLVTTTDYTRARGGPAVRRSIQASCRAGAVPFVSDIEFTRVPREPPRCVSRP